jgi:hypothetical protein
VLLQLQHPEFDFSHFQYLQKHKKNKQNKQPEFDFSHFQYLQKHKKNKQNKLESMISAV